MSMSRGGGGVGGSSGPLSTSGLLLVFHISVIEAERSGCVLPGKIANINPPRRRLCDVFPSCLGLRRVDNELFSKTGPPVYERISRHALISPLTILPKIFLASGDCSHSAGVYSCRGSEWEKMNQSNTSWEALRQDPTMGKQLGSSQHHLGCRPLNVTFLTLPYLCSEYFFFFFLFFWWIGELLVKAGKERNPSSKVLGI